MDTIFSGLAVGAAGLGILLAVVYFLAVGVRVVRARRGGSDLPELPGLGYTGGGLTLGLATFYLGRGLVEGEWGVPQDAVGLVMVLGVASLGFGCGHEWLQGRRAPGSWPAWSPLGLSMLTGGLLGVSALTLGV